MSNADIPTSPLPSSVELERAIHQAQEETSSLKAWKIRRAQLRELAYKVADAALNVALHTATGLDDSNFSVAARRLLSSMRDHFDRVQGKQGQRPTNGSKL